MPYWLQKYLSLPGEDSKMDGVMAPDGMYQLVTNQPVE
jgi:hypothetical protein